MSSDNLQKLLAAVAIDPTLQSRISEILTSEKKGEASEALAALAAEAGLPVSAEEIRGFLAVQAGDELRPDQLEGIAGGYMESKNFKSPFED